MSEILPPPTHYKFQCDLGSGRSIVRELDVPFSLDQIETLKSLRDIRATWSDSALKCSGLLRELYVNLVKIPWATVLTHRDVALSDIRFTITNIRTVREIHSQSKYYAAVADDLSQIEQGLLPFVPDMQEKQEK